MNEGIKKLENEAEEMQKHLDKLKAKIADMKKSELPVIEAGKFYRSIHGPIVYATKSTGYSNNYFTGVEIGATKECGIWSKRSFPTEVKPTWEEI